MVKSFFSFTRWMGKMAYSCIFRISVAALLLFYLYHCIILYHFCIIFTYYLLFAFLLRMRF